MPVLGVKQERRHVIGLQLAQLFGAHSQNLRKQDEVHSVSRLNLASIENESRWKSHVQAACEFKYICW